MSLVARYWPRFVVLTLPRYHTWRFGGSASQSFPFAMPRSLIVIEVFDLVSLLTTFLHHPDVWLHPVSGSQVLVGRLGVPQSMFTQASENLRPVWPSAKGRPVLSRWLRGD